MFRFSGKSRNAVARPGVISALHALLLAIALILATAPQQAMADWPVALAASDGAQAEIQPRLQPLAMALEDLDESGPAFDSAAPSVAAAIRRVHALTTLYPTGIFSLDQRPCQRPYGRGPPTFLFS